MSHFASELIEAALGNPASHITPVFSGSRGHHCYSSLEIAI